MHDLRDDLRSAFRQLRRSPGFSIVALATLGLGIGATTAIFAVLDSVVLDPLPYPDAERLVWLDSPVPGYRADATFGLSVAGYFHFVENNRAFDALGAYSVGHANLGTDAGARRIDDAAVTASVFDALGARPALGRLIAPGEDRPGGGSVVVLGHDFWMRQYGGDPGVIGSIIELDAWQYEIVGVLAPGFELPKRTVNVWRPLRLDPSARPVNSHWLQAVGRLAPGVSDADAERDLARLTTQFTDLFPGAYGDTFMRETEFSTRVTPLRDFVIGDVARTLWILLAAVGLVLVIACANSANLYLARLEGRRRELAVRAALGAGRARLVRHGLAEGLVLGGLAGAVGILLASSGLDLLLALSPEGLPRLREIALDRSVLAFAAALSVAVGAAFGLVVLFRTDVDIGALREGTRGLTASGDRQRLRRTLVVGQIALALVLLAGAGLLLRSFERLRSVEPGLDPTGVLAVEIALPAASYGDYEEVERFYREALARIETLPGVRSLGAASVLPLERNYACAAMFIEGRPLGPGETPPCVPYSYVAPGFFETLRVPLRGEEPGWADVEGRAGGVVITRALAERVWPGENPIGKGIRGNGRSEPYYRVVGVTDHLYAGGLDEPPMEAVYFPMLPIEGAGLWMPPRSMRLVVRSASADPTELTPAIREIISSIDPSVPLGVVRTMEGIVADSMARLTFILLLLGVAAGMGLFLSAIGLYGVIAYVVGQRTGEIGIRMALGARHEQVAGMVVRESLALAATGIAIGVAGALAATRLLRSLLYEISPADPVTLAAVSAGVAIVALAAGYLPARRAARVDPMVALRAE